MESIWAANPKATEMFVFSDGNAFLTKKEADSYALRTKTKYTIATRHKQEEKPVMESSEVAAEQEPETTKITPKKRE